MTRPLRIVFLVHYFPPINSSGAKRVEALSKYLAADGHEVTVITTRKTARDGAFTEEVAPGVRLIELGAFGRLRASQEVGGPFEPMSANATSTSRRLKDRVMEWLGQVPDPRLPFAFRLASPWLADEARAALRNADVVVGSCPPWPMLPAALIARARFGVPCILEYRDQFSECHEMPGGRFAKWLEKAIDRRLAAAATHVVAISDPMTTYYRAFTPAISTIRNGYDPEVMDAARARAKPANDGSIVIRYMGLVSPGRVPHRFFEALTWLADAHPERFKRIRVEYFGHAALIREAVETTYAALRPAVHVLEPVRYLDSITKIVEADYALFAETSSTGSLSAQGILTTKLLEYIGAGRPVIAEISPTTIAGQLLRSCGEQHVITQSADVFRAMLADERFYQRQPDARSSAADALSRRAQAREYASLVARVAATRSS